jgi:GNAT superfamily N-acetyltransferase
VTAADPPEARLDALLEAFLARTLPAAEWTHEAHLLVGLMLARRLPEAELLPFLRQAISAYNIASGGENTDTTGYQDSITAFYAATLAAFARATADLPAAEAARCLLASPLADRDAVGRAYTPSTLKTVAARRARAPWDRDDFDPEALAAEALASVDSFVIRLAAKDDISILHPMMQAAIGELQKPFLTDEAIEASREVMGIDTQLIADQTYFVVELGSGAQRGLAVGCGGWSRRATLFGGDHSAGRDAAPLDPTRDAARVRAMYTRPGFERRGIGRKILAACEAAAAREGFTACELAGTLAGEPLYRACGYEVVESFEAETRAGPRVPLLRMRKALG